MSSRRFPIYASSRLGAGVIYARRLAVHWDTLFFKHVVERLDATDDWAIVSERDHALPRW